MAMQRIEIWQRLIDKHFDVVRAHLGIKRHREEEIPLGQEHPPALAMLVRSITFQERIDITEHGPDRGCPPAHIGQRNSCQEQRRPFAHDRIRQELADEPGLTERKMFGGLGFMLDGNMAVAASGQANGVGGLMVRADPETSEAFLAEGAEPMQMQGRAMRGWLLVAPDLVADEESVARWVRRGADYARTLPAK